MGRVIYMLKETVSRKTSLTRELAAKKAASSRTLKYTDPWTAPAA
jgi:hypothetical protein